MQPLLLGSTPSIWTKTEVAEEGLFPEVESLATRMKGLARCGEDLFYSVFSYVLNEPIPTSSPRGTRVADVSEDFGNISVED